MLTIAFLRSLFTRATPPENPRIVQRPPQADPKWQAEQRKRLKEIWEKHWRDR